jgi:transcriptional regulator with XRE-family HTH domain
MNDRLPLDRLPSLVHDRGETRRPVAEERFSEAEMDDIKRGFARRLRTAFDEATNAEIARRCHTTSTTVKLYAEAQRLPIAEMLLQITRVTGINIHWLLTGRGSRRVEHEDMFSEEEESRIRELAARHGRTFDDMVRSLTLAAADMLRNFD